MSVKVYIDGNSGTTGLRIHTRLSAREDFTFLTLPDALRKDPEAKKNIYSEADIVFLCLPDAAAVEAAALADTIRRQHALRLIDTSTAHRTSKGWQYGFPELSSAFHRGIETAANVAVPGCHASGFIALIKPLVDAGILSEETALSCFSLTGYSGGGKQMIAAYENDTRSALLSAPRQYGLAQTHKHLKEMQGITRLSSAPAFCPIVGDFYSGMQVTVPLFKKDLRKGDIQAVKEVYRSIYNGAVVQYAEDITDGNGFISAAVMQDRDSMRISVLGNEDRLLLTAVYDNLGKGASGAAIQCLNLMCGLDETAGLVI